METHSPSWQPRGSPPPLASGQVHVWQVRLQATPDQLAVYRSLLHPEELARADRFYFPDLRLKFSVARATLRRLLGAYLACPPTLPTLANGPHGKPSLAPHPSPPWKPGLEFNISHSGELALMAFCWQHPLGVDLEQQRPNRDLPGLARHSFSPSELAVWSALPPELQLEGFFNAWSRKEAFIKALGDGLYRSLKSFDVSLDPRQPMQLLASRPDPDEARQWELRALPTVEGFSTALCIPNRQYPTPPEPPLDVQCFAWLPGL